MKQLLKFLINPEKVERVPSYIVRGLLVWVLICFIGVIRKKSNIPDKSPVSKETVSQVDTSRNGKDYEFDSDGNLVGRVASNASSCEYIEGLQAADIYANLEKKGYKVEKFIDSDGAIYECSADQNGINYQVEVGCTKSVSDVTEIGLMATRVDYEYTDVEDMKPFLKYGCSIQYNGSDYVKISRFIDENYNVDGASTVISGVRFTIHSKNEYIRTVSISKE
ncbi:MAG: hypothetical protein V4543_14810 [Bacteroidota bacterium]